MKGNISHENIPVLGLLKKSQRLTYFTTPPRQAYYLFLLCYLLNIVVENRNPAAGGSGGCVCVVECLEVLEHWPIYL